MLTNELSDYFEKKAKQDGSKKITFATQNQGSYSMGTGIKALEEEDFDIDVMVLFNISKDDYTPVKVKEWVYAALSKANRTVEYKKPCVRVQYLKKGEKQYHIDLALYAAQNSGIALTALAYNLFQPEVSRRAFDSSVAPNDLLALKNLTERVISQFSIWNNRISVELPVEPFNNLFEKMTDGQQKTFKQRLVTLKNDLNAAISEPDPHEASKLVRKHLGADFPLVDKESSGQQSKRGIVGTSDSGAE